MDQLIELNDTVRNIVDMHPAQHVYDVMQKADDAIAAIAAIAEEGYVGPHVL